MAPMMLVILIALACLGIILISLGWRGKRVNDHPICKWCRFDLSGSYPEVITCPECGAGLKRPGAIQSGLRRRLPLVLVSGILCILFALTPVGLVGYAVLTGSDVSKTLPLGVLLFESRFADGSLAKNTADELLNRILSGKLDNAQYQRVVEAALARQADRSRSWDEAWGDIIERARFDNQLSESQSRRFTEASFVLDAQTRPRTLAGGYLPVTLSARDIRVGRSTTILVPIRLKAQSLDGEPLEIAQRQAAPSLWGSAFSRLTINGLGQQQDDTDAIGSFTITGSRPQGVFGGGNDNREIVVLKIPENSRTGARSLHLDLAASAYDTMAMGTVSFFQFGKPRAAQPEPTQIPHKRDLAVTVEPAAAPTGVITTFTPDETQTSSLTAHLTPATAVLRSTLLPGKSPLAGTLTIGFKGTECQVPFAYKVFARDSGREYPLGTLISSKDPLSPETMGLTTFSSTVSITFNGKTVSQSSDGTSRLSVTGDAPPELSDRIDIILRPDPAAATRSPDQDRCADKELVFKDIHVTRDAMPALDNSMDSMMNNMLRNLGQPPQNTPPKKRKAPF